MFFVTTCFLINAQEPNSVDLIPPSDTLQTTVPMDSSAISVDTLHTAVKQPGKKKSSGLDAPVEYTAEDSIIYDLDSQFVYLFGNAIVNYEDITLTADFIRFDMGKKEVLAHGMPDSAGNIVGNPIFKQAADEYEAKRLNYNFNSRQAYIEGIITEQEGGFLHSSESKKQNNEEIHALNNKYTTCDLEDPHFYIALNKAIIIPNKKIVSGRAHFVVADVPLYFPFLPFGYFPTPKKRSAGILVPTFGDEGTGVNSRGSYLRDLGYYWPINDYLDLTLMSDIYTKGSWGVDVGSEYKKLYRYGGNFNLEYQKSVSGDKGFGNEYSEKKYYRVTWSHRQDPKANPTQTFSAKVNFSTSGYDKDYGRSIKEQFNSSKSSSINYSKKWDHTFLGTNFNVSTSMNHNQNSQTETQTVTFPNLSASSGYIYPFPKKDDDSEKRFYHDIRTKYTAKIDNRYTNKEDVFIDELNLENMDSRFYHEVKTDLPIKKIKFLPFNLSLGNYKSWMYTKHYEYVWDPTLTRRDGDQTLQGDFRKDTIYGFSMEHYFNPMPSFENITLNKNLFVTLQSTKEESHIQALRYAMMPKASFNITLPKSGKTPSYYRTVYSPDSSVTKFYSIYEGVPYGSPPGATKKTNWRGNVNLTLENSLEMKVRSKNDTTNEETKIKLLDNLSFGSSYDIFAEDYHWSDIRFNTGTGFFKKKITVRVSGAMDPYTLDDIGNKIEKFEIHENDRLARLTNMNLNMNLKFGGNPNKEKGEDGDNTEVNDYDYFDVPWSFSAGYTWRYSKPSLEARVTQTLDFNGRFDFTKNWGFNYRVAYDLETNQIATTSFDIYRDLHCWEMALRVVNNKSRPFFEFTINAKGSLLRDLKYDFDRNWREY